MKKSHSTTILSVKLGVNVKYINRLSSKLFYKETEVVSTSKIRVKQFKFPYM